MHSLVAFNEGKWKRNAVFGVEMMSATAGNSEAEGDSMRKV